MARVAVFKYATVLMGLLLANQVYALDYYQCTASDQSVSLQDTPCSEGKSQSKLVLPDIKASETAESLRPLELLELKRLHETLLHKAKAESKSKSMQFVNADPFKSRLYLEHIRLKEGKTRFDINYRNFWVYGFSDSSHTGPWGLGNPYR